MSKNLENTKLKKLPTSQLIFYMSNPELDDEGLKNKIEATIYSRLTKQYKLYPDVARSFVEREQEVIGIRGYNIDDYAFGKDMPYDQLFRIFYENVKFGVTSDINMGRLNTLTMSEMVEFANWFSIYKTRFKDRCKILRDLIKDNQAIQISTLNNDKISIDTKEQQINELKKFSEVLRQQQREEQPLIGYNNMQFHRMLNGFENVMGYGESQILREILTILKECFLLHQKSPIQRQELAQLSDLNFDAYTYYTRLPIEYNVPGYQFYKK